LHCDCTGGFDSTSATGEERDNRMTQWWCCGYTANCFCCC